MTRSLWRTLTVIGLLCLLSLLAAACGGGGGEGETNSGTGGEAGNVERGEKLFSQTVIGSHAAPGCRTCHSLEEGITIVGPSMAGIASRAGQEVSGQSAEEYLHQSIVEPDAHVVEGFPAGVMYQKYEEDLSAQEIDDLVAYLLTLE